MARYVCVHIGVPKTGTSFLQRFFRQNEKRLARAGVLYPKAGRRVAGHHQFASAFRNWSAQWIGHVDPAQVLSQLRSEIEAAPMRRVLLSSEALFGINAIDRLVDFFASDDLEIFVYVRRPDDLVNSMYSQQVKMGRTLERPEEFAARREPGLDFDRRVARWERVAGIGRIRLLRYEEVRSDLEGPILQALGADGEGFQRPVQANPSPDRRTLAFLASMSREYGPLTGAHWERVRELLGRRAEELGYAGERFDIGSRLRRKVLEGLETGNRNLFQRFGLDDPDCYAADRAALEGPADPDGLILSDSERREIVDDIESRLQAPIEAQQRS